MKKFIVIYICIIFLIILGFSIMFTAVLKEVKKAGGIKNITISAGKDIKEIIHEIKGG